jgi:hypothetical protein
MRNKSIFFVLFFILLADLTFSSPNEFRWGGKGHDAALKGKYSSRFTVKSHYKDDTIIDILVDDKWTVGEVGQMDLVLSDNTKISSNQCGKAMRHISAPWVCSFSKDNFQKISGKGTIRVYDRSNKLLVQDRIYFDAINKKFGVAQNSDSSKKELVLPKRVGLYFIPSPQGNKLPALELTVFAGNGCDQAGTLQIAKEIKSSQPNMYTKGGRIDVLKVQIKGYEFQEAPQKSDIVCPGDIIESRAVIELNEVLTNQKLQLQIILNDQINTFDLNQHENVIYLNPIESLQIISWNPGENMPERPQGLGFMTDTFRERLAQARLNGNYAHKSDLATRLRNYIRDAGYEPIDEKLLGFPQMDPLEGFIAFVPFGKVLPEDFKIIGKVPYHEIPGGEKTIEVGIIKKEAMNPFFVRY